MKILIDRGADVNPTDEVSYQVSLYNDTYNNNVVATYTHICVCIYIATWEEFFEEQSFLNLAFMTALSLMRDLCG